MNEKQLSLQQLSGSPLRHPLLLCPHAGPNLASRLVIRPQKETKLPDVLSVDEVQRILGCVYKPLFRICLSTIYACGLRLNEGISLQIATSTVNVRCSMCARAREPKTAMCLCPKRRWKCCAPSGRFNRHPTSLFPGHPSEGEPYAAADTADEVEWRATGHACCSETSASRRKQKCTPCATPMQPITGSWRQSALYSGLPGP